MANPFLVLGGIAISVITAAFGVLAVPGWVASVQDAAALNDLANIRAVQAAAVSHDGAYLDGFDTFTADTHGIAASLSGSTDLLGVATDGADAWCAAAATPSGAFFAASDDKVSTTAAADPAVAMTAAGCTTAATNTILDRAYGPLTEGRRNLAANPVGREWKQSSVPLFGFMRDRFISYGAYSLDGDWARFTPTVNTRADVYGFHLANNPDLADPTPGSMVPVQTGDTYTVSMKVRLSAGANAGSYICWRFGTEAATYVGGRSCTQPVPVSATAATVSATFTAPAGATRVAAYVLVDSLRVGSYMEASQLLAEKSAVVGTFFHGGMASDSSLWEFAWVGPQNASPSVLLTRPRQP